MSSLEPLDLVSFTGGLNVRRNQLVLGETESPDMLNVNVDPRGGFYTRKGWQRWNLDDVYQLDQETDWHPRLAKLHPLSDGSFQVFVANNNDGVGEVLASGPSAVFSNLSVPCSASPHLCDFAAWGDTTYMATGGISYSSDSGAVGVALSDPVGAWNDDYTNPVDGFMPQADFCEAHSGYLFVAGTAESGTPMPNRIRWSHPDQPEDWAELDYIDIERGGGKITGLLSFRDHLLIFKDDSVWALYGYDLDSWQLVNVSTSIGTPSIQAITHSESAVYFYSSSGRGGIYGYAGQSPVEISEPVLPILEEITIDTEVWLGWVGDRLWCSIPVESNTVLVFDADIGQGVWLRYRSGLGSVGPLVERSSVSTEYPLAAIDGDAGAACLVYLDFRNDALDVILETYANVLTDGTDGFILTDDTDGLQLGWASTVILGSPFDAYYRTGWKHAGWPERRKSWRRPRYVAQVPEEPVAVRANVYWDYNILDVRRSSLGFFDGKGGAYWRALGSGEPQGFDWGDGTLWGTESEGSTLERATIGLGVCRSLQIEVRSDPGTPGKAWGIDSLHLKYRLRRFTS